jgi:protein-tyrosine phosphatase
MAEGLFLHHAKENFSELKVSSAGINALVGYPADVFAQEIMKRKGFDISRHRARQITIDLLLKSDLILVMERVQQKHLECNFPGMYGRIHRLGKWREVDISDPFQQQKEVFEQTFDLIEQSVYDWKERLLHIAPMKVMTNLDKDFK